MLEIKNLHKAFGEQKVLNGLNITVKEGKIYTLLGRNGTGKTTLFNLITGFLRPDSGEIWYNSKRLNKLSSVAINSEGITRTFQDLRIINQLTVKENILLSFKNNPGESTLNALQSKRTFQKQYREFNNKANEIIAKVHLEDVVGNLACEISFGQQKLLTIGCCLANDSRLLLLDEPVAGIDKDNYTRIYNLILQLKSEGKTILQIEHNHNFAERLSDGIWFLNSGMAFFFNDYKTFASDRTVKEVYLN